MLPGDTTVDRLFTQTTKNYGRMEVVWLGCARVDGGRRNSAWSLSQPAWRRRACPRRHGGRGWTCGRL